MVSNERFAVDAKNHSDAKRTLTAVMLGRVFDFYNVPMDLLWAIFERSSQRLR